MTANNQDFTLACDAPTVPVPVMDVGSTALLGSVVRRLDTAYWEACKRADLALDVSVGTPEEWAAWARAIKRQMRGYWHGETGCIADRLPIPDDEWEAACDLHCPGWRTNKVIGDAVLNPYRRVMMERAGLLLPNVKSEPRSYMARSLRKQDS